MASERPVLIVDAHEDLAWNMQTFERDYMRDVADSREKESRTSVPDQNGDTLLGRDAWLAGRVGVIFGTLFAAPAAHRLGEWDTQIYHDAQGAYRIAGQQLDLYYRMAEDHDLFHLIGTRADLDEVLVSWDEDEAEDETRRIGLVPLMEGADPIIEPPQVEEWYERGVRMVGPAWKETRYAGGTGRPGPLTAYGFELLAAMQDLNMVLDLSHLAEEAYFQAVEAYEGPQIASHSNPRRFFPDSLKDRGLSDEMISVLAERDGVVGIVFCNAFLDPRARRSDKKSKVRLAEVLSAIDHVCQVTGSVDHVALGTDFDGGFGWDWTPAEINTVADLRKLIPMLADAGYSPEQVDAIMHGNWLRILRRALPD